MGCKTWNDSRSRDQRASHINLKKNEATRKKNEEAVGQRWVYALMANKRFGVTPDRNVGVFCCLGHSISAILTVNNFSVFRYKMFTKTKVKLWRRRYILRPAKQKILFGISYKLCTFDEKHEHGKHLSFIPTIEAPTFCPSYMLKFHTRKSFVVGSAKKNWCVLSKHMIPLWWWGMAHQEACSQWANSLPIADMW